MTADELHRGRRRRVAHQELQPRRRRLGEEREEVHLGKQRLERANKTRFDAIRYLESIRHLLTLCRMYKIPFDTTENV